MNKVTIKDIAEKVGVSANTVSRAINDKGEISEETKEEILEVAKELDYRPNRLARGLRLNKTGILGVVVADNANPFFGAVVKGIEEVAEKNGYSVILKDTEENYAREEKSVEIMIAEQVEGVVISPVQKGRRSLQILEDASIPYVLLARYFDDIRADYVAIDDEQGGFLATQHLLEREHRRIAFINGPQYNSSAQARFKGYKKALTEAEVKIDKSLIKYGALSEEDGYKFGQELLSSNNHPSAIFTFSDYVALGAIRAVHKRGFEIPEDISVLGYDNIVFSRCLKVPLTTISVPKRKLGREACRLLVRKIENDEKDQVTQKKLPVELLKRSTTK
ncbi:LacI family DNA-binding transcriptional regulator [Candidatus Bipolaricaulota bacterium]|nr:LacI family DNA-binding transcriptional regulator [Candidatus Bipolaricaulota bacterium]